ncbi:MULTISPECIES: TIGR04219 family outer membrane beta-barrel protein [unclassified Motilimonas]|uniref:TIGR04219 family outer membrane beta-barrel protein n=1 Tax=Motilimonas TaxID=1914248 RepID=UPI001E63673A|nr:MULTISPECIES: TIGR04219 family outer membrane beta-barrel protein [unclassified Motilimonas]MCE0558132.1 TIGR04219 family outer membrane beta-barrel protein [Motilimonas sp. E26]MDO6524491.1 TIGR04219 family outer membrane beta-barrel protein [Motilimonas sp. 1_MG-2023]
MKKYLAATLFTLAISHSASADDWGIFAGVDIAKPVTDGKLDSDSLSLKNDWRGSGYVAIEHGIILLPNVKFAYTNLDSKGSSSTSDVTLDMSSFDTILYYQLFDNGLFEADLGLNVKYISGDLHTLSNNHFNSTIPQAYGAAKFHIPNTGLSVFTDVTAGSVTDDEVVDALIGVSYAFNPEGLTKVNLRGGYRYQEVKLKDDVKLNTEYDGIFVGVEVNF